MSIQNKLFLQTVLTIVIILSLGAFFYFKSIDTVFEKDMQSNIKHDIYIINNYIQDIKNRTVFVAQDLGNDEKVITSLNLISKYEDKNDYQALVFDREKRKLFENTQHWLSGYHSNIEFKFYNNKKEFLASQSNFTSSSYITWEDKKPLLVTNDGKKLLQKVEVLSDECTVGIVNKFENGQYRFCHVSEVKRLNDVMGYVKVAHYFSQKDITQLQQNLSNQVYFSAKNQAVGQAISETSTIFEKQKELIYKQEPKLYATFLIDTAFLQEQKSMILKNLFILGIVLAILSFVVSWYISKYLILDRIKLIKNSIESVKDNEYKKIKNTSSDELGKIIDEFNLIFEKLSDSFAFLDSYKKSVDIANIVSRTDIKGKITYVNEEFCKISGYSEKELLGKSHNIIRHPDMKEETFKELWETILTKKPWHGIIKNRKKDGGHYWADSVVSPILDTKGEIKEFISIRRNITELVEQKEALQRIANFDSITDLGSRSKLQRDLDSYDSPAIALININRFSQINDFYGHKFGDMVLKKFAWELNDICDKMFQQQVQLYRPNSDEFVILYNGQKDKFILNIEQILQFLEKKDIEVENEEVDIKISCGVSFEPHETILLTADMALKLAKKENKTLTVYDPEQNLNKVYESNITWTRKLKDAIANDRIVPFFQPIINNENLKWEKYEALVRMIDTDGKVISPFFFLNIAKQTKQYEQLTKIMIEKTFKIFANKKESFSINLTAQDILSLDIAEFIAQKLQEYPKIGNRLIFEIVESESIESYSEVIEFINKAKHMGCRIAIDDFGTGYSNFEYLIKLKADFIKIDGSLVKNIVTNKESRIVVSTIVTFAKEMGIETVAEFVEDKHILQKLQEVGVDYSQGYHFSPPLESLNN